MPYGNYKYLNDFKHILIIENNDDETQMHYTLSNREEKGYWCCD